MERFLLPVPSKRSRNSDLVRANETESTRLPQSEVDNSSDVNRESDTDRPLERLPGIQGRQLAQRPVPLTLALQVQVLTGLSWI